MKTTLLSLAAAALTAGGVTAAAAEPVFNRIASFPVANNIPDGTAMDSTTSSEIITASEDGMMLIYSDSGWKSRGIGAGSRGGGQPFGRLQ